MGVCFDGAGYDLEILDILVTRLVHVDVSTSLLVHKLYSTALYCG